MMSNLLMILYISTGTLFVGWVVRRVLPVPAGRFLFVRVFFWLILSVFGGSFVFFWLVILGRVVFDLGWLFGINVYIVPTAAFGLVIGIWSQILATTEMKNEK